MSNPSAINRVLDEATTPGPNRKAVALVGVVVNDTGRTIYSHRSGNPDNHSLSDNSLFWLASLTKFITAVAALTLVEQGLIKLDDDVSEYLEEIKQLKVATGEDGATLVEKEGPVTLRRMLTFTAGFGYPSLDSRMKKWDEGVNMLDGTDGLLHRPLHHQPGSAWSYGTSCDWIGVLASKLSGKSFEEYCRINIFDPLGMKNTTFHPEKAFADYRERLVPIATPDSSSPGSFNYPKETFCHAIPSSFASGGGGIFSTPTDYALFLAAILADGKDGKQRVLKKETVEEMFKPQLEDRSLYAEIVKPGSAMREVLAGVFDNGDGNIPELDFGLGGSMNLSDIEGRRKKGSINWGGATNCIWWMDRESGIGGCMFTQQWPPSPELGKVFKAWEREVYANLVRK